MSINFKKVTVKFCRGDLVWGKLASFPWWPAVVIDAEDCGRDDGGKDKLWLFWFGDNKVAEVKYEKIKDFKKEYKSNFLKKNGKKFVKAVEETLVVLAESHNHKFLNSSSLFEWAANGFITQARSQYKKITELPKCVLDTLKRYEFQRESSSESDMEEDEEEYEKCAKLESVITDVLKGVKQLKDICISCCKPNAIIVMQHQFFIGGVCSTCKKSVLFSCKIPFGIPQDFCVICGQGGILVLCSNSLCSRSFCNLCIDYLAPQGSYEKILKESMWSCYLCETVSRKNCLIIPRTIDLPKQVPLIPVPLKKLPINVIAHSDTIESVLKEKHFLIGRYASKPACPASMDDIYNEDFTFKEFCEISADLVCSCYLIDPSKCEVDNKDVEMLFVEFYRFMYRLDNARLLKSKVFFAFISDGEICNYLVKTRMQRFLEIEPVYMKSRRKKFCLWSNIPNCSSKVSQAQKCFDNDYEAHLFAPIVELLSEYFKIKY